MIETLVNADSTEFRTGVLQTLGKLIEGERGKFPLADRPDDVAITPYVIYAGYDPQKIIFRRADFTPMPFFVTENILFETLLLKPRYLSVTMDGVKVLDEAQGTEVSSYLVFFFKPAPESQEFSSLIQIMEIEYGPEDGGWMAEPQEVNTERFDGYLKDRMSLFARLYLALRD